MKNFLKNKTYIRFLYIFIAIIVIVSFIFFLKNKKNNNENEYLVTKTTVSDELVFAGIVESEKRVDLGFAVSGRVSKIYFNEGDFIKKDQVIAELDQNTLKADLMRANANYTLTKVDTASSLIDVTDGFETTINEQNAIVEGLRQQYLSGDLIAYLEDDTFIREITPPTVTGSYSGEKEGLYRLKVFRSSSASGFSFRLFGLENGTYTAEIYSPGKLGNLGLFIQFKEGIDYNNTEWIIEVPNTRSSTYFSRKFAYENALATRERITSNVTNNLNKSFAIDLTTNTSRSDAQIKSAKAQVNSIYSRLGDGKIRAPFDGYIAKNDLNVGEIINAFETPIIFIKNKNKKLVLNVPEIYVNKINLGDIVSIELDAYPGEFFDGEIVSIDTIDTIVDGVPVYQTEVFILTKDERLRIGMNAHAYITASKKENVIAIPKYFIIDEYNKKFTFVKNGKDKQKQEIITGLDGNNGLVEVISGLTEGQSIVLDKS